MICPNCSNTVRDGAAFCKYCGCSLTVSPAPPMQPQMTAPAQTCCPRCYAVSAPNAPFCESCGLPFGTSPAPAAPVKVKRYGFLRFLLVLIIILCLLECLRIPSQIKEAQSGEISHATLIPFMDHLKLPKKTAPLPENAFGTGNVTPEQQAEYARIASQHITPEAGDTIHDQIFGGTPAETPAMDGEEGAE